MRVVSPIWYQMVPDVSIASTSGSSDFICTTEILQEQREEEGLDAEAVTPVHLT